MNYHKIGFDNVQQMFDRIALLEWFKKNGEMNYMDWEELDNLRQLSMTYAEKRAQLALKRS